MVDDDDTVASVLVSYLQRAGHTARRACDGLEAVDAVSAAAPDLLVLDLMLPGIDGLEVCRRVRAARPDLPVVMLTALAEPDDRIAGLEVGADDYVSKPFSPRELVLRVESVLRRAKGPGEAERSTVLTAGDIALDTAARRATKDGDELALTIRELDLLAFLMANPGQAFKRSQLMREVWGWTFGDQSTVTVHVRRLREKVESDPTNPTLIQTVWGIGYRLELPSTPLRSGIARRDLSVHLTAGNAFAALLWCAIAGVAVWLVLTPVRRRSFTGLLATLVLTGAAASAGALGGAIHAMLVPYWDWKTMVVLTAISAAITTVAAVGVARRFATTPTRSALPSPTSGRAACPWWTDRGSRPRSRLFGASCT